MARINIHGPDGFEGWFDPDRAERWAGEDSILFHAVGGRWVIHTPSGHQFITDDEARGWLERNSLADAVEEFFIIGPVVGRPEIGGLVKVRLGDRLAQVDELAARRDISRADAIRYLVDRGLETEGTRT